MSGKRMNGAATAGAQAKLADQGEFTELGLHNNDGGALMAKFLIEVPHEPEPNACLQAVRILLATGSHFLTHADFGCFDGEHKAWIIVDIDTKEEARNLLPPLYRPRARIVKLNKFTLDEVDQMIRQHAAKA